MKQIVYLILIGLMPIFLPGCVDESFGNRDNAASDGVVFEFTYKPFKKKEVSSRAKADADAENRVNDVLLVFFEKADNDAGKFLYKVKTNLTSGGFVHTNEVRGTALRARKVFGKSDFAALMQNKQNLVVYAFANTEEETKDWVTGSGRSLSEEIDNANNLTLAQFKTWTFHLKDKRGINDEVIVGSTDFEGVTERATQAFMMIGHTEMTGLDYAQTNAVVANIYLERMDAKVEFRVKSNDNLKLFPKRWRVHNIPVTTTVGEDIIYTGPLYNPDNLRWRDFEGLYILENGGLKPATQVTGNEISTFTFYMPRNIQRAQKNINQATWREAYGMTGLSQFTPKAWQLYGMRTLAKNRPINPANRVLKIDTRNGVYYYGNRQWNPDGFEFAPARATWVELLCDVYQDIPNVSGGNSYQKLVGENVVYRVILGEPEGNGPIPDNNSYSILHNCHYVYDIQVNGLADIEAEVEVDNAGYGKYEDNSAVDGHLVQASTAEMDSHYDAKAVLINYNDIVTKYTDDTPAADWLDNYEVITPFDFTGRQSNDYRPGWKAGKSDTAWVSFFIHPRTSMFGTSIHPRFTLPYEFVRTNFPENNSFWKKYYRKGPRDLMRYLAQAVKAIRGVKRTSGAESASAKETMEYWGFDAETGDMILTVYANEFYYDDYPDWLNRGVLQIYTDKTVSHVLTAGDDWKRNAWRLFVNRPNREIRITLGNKGPLISSDGQSSLIKSDIYVYQHSIMAPYKLIALPLNYTGYGAELIEEDEWMDKGYTLGFPGKDYKRPQYSHVYNNNDYAPLQGYENIYDGRTLFLTMLYSGWIDGRHWWDLINYNPGTHSDLLTNAMRNIRGLLDQSQYRFYQTVVGNGKTGGDNWPGAAVMMRNRESNPNGDFRNAIISNEEVKWYLPSLPQLEYLWMAESAIPANYRLRSDKPYLTSTRLTNATNQLYTENIMFRANYGTTVRQRIVEATSGLRNPYAWDLGDPETRYYYGWNQAFVGQYSDHQENNAALRVRAVRTLGVYNPNRIYRPAQRWLRGIGFTSDTQDGPSEMAQIIIDCTNMPDEMLRTIPVRTGPLPEHTLNSIWARPFKAFRVAKVSVQTAKIRNGWNHDDNGYDNPIDGKWAFPKRNLPNQPDTYRVDPNTSKPIRAMFDEDPNHPCRSYVEYGYSSRGGDEIGGWRLPNAMELMLMVRLIPPQQLLDLTTKNWSPLWQTAANGYAKGSDRNWSGNSHDSRDTRVETLGTSWYNPAYLMSKTDTEDHKRFYGASFWAQLYGFRARQMDDRYWSKLDMYQSTGGAIYDTRFDIRCVKDLTEAEVQDIIEHSTDRFNGDAWIYPAN